MSPSNMKNEVGNRYGKLTVVERAGSVNWKATWLCQCDCGETITLAGDSLRAGKTKSCGCYRRSGEFLITHGHARYVNKVVSRTYKSWQSMRERCNRPTNTSFHNYGAKGIAICKRWDKFELFLEDMGERPAGTSLDRKNNAVGYSKSNCQWSNRLVQARNRSICIQVKFRGRTANLAEWCAELSIPYPRTYYRLVVRGWSTDKAFTHPTRGN